MSNIKVYVQIRPLGQRDIKHKREEWIVTNNNSLQCANHLHPCDFKFDHIFGTRSLNCEVYLSIVKPIVESCLIGLNGTIITYGSSSSGKNDTFVGSSPDPGIILITIEKLFIETDGCSRRKIRFGYIEIYKEMIFDLLDNRKAVQMDTHQKFDFMLSNDEVVVENVDFGVETLINGSYKRKSSSKDDSKLSNLSHSIFRITIESEDETNGKVQTSYLTFVHVAGCEPMTEMCPSDSLAGDSSKSLFWFNVVINGLSNGEKDIYFNNSVLTTLLRESLTGHSNTAIICNVEANASEETISTLKFVSRARNIRTLPIRSEIHNVPASCSTADECKMTHMDDQLKEIADLRVENLFLRKELEEVKAVFASRNNWFEEQMKVSEFAQQKLELAREEDKKLIGRLKTDFEQKIKSLVNSNDDFWMKSGDLKQGTSGTGHSLPHAKDSLILQEKGNLNLARKSAKFLERQQRGKEVEAGIKRKIQRLENDLTNNIKMLKHELHCKKARVEPSTPIEWTVALKTDDTETRTTTVKNYLIGRLIGVGGTKLRKFNSKTGAKVTISERNGDSDRVVTLHGVTSSVSMVGDLIEQALRGED